MPRAAGNPAGHLGPQDWLRADETIRVMDALGSNARFVGGCVRDALLGRPVRDIDIATPLTPEDVIAACEQADLKSVPTGISHGTVTVVVASKPFEVTTLRRDVKTDGRHAVVAFSDDWAEDAARRDFTINALSSDRHGNVHDYFGGLADLKAGHIRFVGDAAQRLAEDRLRLLRYFRFSAHYARTQPDQEALEACRAEASRIDTLSGERLRKEMFRLLEAPDPARWLRIMAREGILEYVLPEAQQIDALGKLTALEAHVPPDSLRRLAACIGPDTRAAETIARRWKLSRRERERLVVASHAPDPPAPGWDADDVRRALFKLGHESTLDHLWLARARSGDTENSLWDTLLEQAGTLPVPVFPLQGRDALDLGVKAGPDLGALLKQVETWWLGGGCVAGREACLTQLISTTRPS